MFCLLPAKLFSCLSPNPEKLAGSLPGLTAVIMGTAAVTHVHSRHTAAAMCNPSLPSSTSYDSDSADK